MMHLLAYRLFIDPLPIYQQWFWLCLPLVALFSIVYKAVKCETMAEVPKAALRITGMIILGMASAAAGLTLLIYVW
jgi:hypothetical protein